MKTRYFFFILCLLFSIAGIVQPVLALDRFYSVKSPDGKTQVNVFLQDRLFYTVEYEKKAILAPSLLGLKFKGLNDFANIELQLIETDSVDENWQYPWGRQLNYNNKFNRILLQATEKDGQKRSLGLEIRAYDDGIAIRYLIDAKTVGANEYTLEKELTQFNFPNDPIAWYDDFGSFNSSQERIYRKSPLSGIAHGVHVGCPIVVKTSEAGPFIALAEAELNRWGGIYFESQELEGMKTLFVSKVLRGGEKAEKFSVDLENADRLELYSDVAGDSGNYDHADWCDLFLTDSDDNKIDLSTFKPIFTSQAWGETRANVSVDGNPLKIGGEQYKTGFGTHPDGKMVFKLDGKYKSLEGTVGVDSEVERRGSVRFTVRSLPKVDAVKLQTKLSPRHDGKGLAVVEIPKNGISYSPWRLVIIAPKAIDLVDQTLLMNVSAPTDPNADWSWIAPGTASWDWWSDDNANMKTETIKPFIDFASEMGWAYHVLDAPWYGKGVRRKDVLKGGVGIDIEELVKYAHEKNVKLILWMHWTDIDRQMEEAFAQYEKWGIAGVKIDFMDRDDQEMVEWYDKTVRLAAKHKLMVDFHGAYKPTGYRKTHPNLITREGIFGGEQNKWTGISPEHYCTLPYTRLMLGPGDFTPGSFLNRHYQGNRVPGYRTAQGTGTRAHELSISLIYDSPLLCMCDRPEIYRNDKFGGLEFYRDLPTVWDESKGVAGEIGEYFSLLRRKGNDWYYGAITATDRELELPLDFLGDGEYEATIYSDNNKSREDARNITIEKITAKSTDMLLIKMIKGGGQAVVFKKR